MNINDYEVFIAVTETANITLAAEKLGYTQSGVSHIIAKLENEFGFPLFMRSKQGVKLTRDGEKMLFAIRDVVKSEELLKQTADEIKGLRSGKIRIGAFSSVAIHWLPEIIKEFSETYPNIEIETEIGTYKTIEDMLLQEKIDCGFMTGDTTTELDFIPLKTDRLLALLPPGHKLSSLPALPLPLTAELDFIIPGEGANYDIGRIFKHAGIRPNVRFNVSDDYAAIAMVNKGLGITIMPELILAGVREIPSVMELDPCCVRTIGLAVRRNIAVSPACRAFMEFVRRHI